MGVRKLEEHQFDVLYKCLRTALYGRQEHGRRFKFRAEPSASTSHLHRHLLLDHTPSSSPLKRLPPLQQARPKFFGKREMSTTARLRAVQPGPSLAQVRYAFDPPKLGDWVAFRLPGGREMTGIIAYISADVAMVLSSKSEMLPASPRSIVFVKPNVVPKELMEQLWSQVTWTPSLDNDMESMPVPNDPASIQTLRQISQLAREFEVHQDRTPLLITRMTLAEIYNRYCNQAYDEPASLSCFQAATYLISREPPKVYEDLYCLAYHAQRHMLEDPVHFVVTPDLQKYGIFTLRPVSHVREFKKVKQWVADRTPEYLGFVKRARKAAQLVAANRSPSAEEHFAGPEDTVFINVLKRSIGTVRALQPFPFVATFKTMTTDILGLDEAQESLETVGSDLLKAIGVFKPWHNLVAEDAQLVSDFRVLHTAKLQAPKGLEYLDRDPLPRTKIYGGDIAKNLRQDWSHLPVYVIDSSDAQERDDGVSIEAASDHNGKKTWWLHAHIADPTSFFHPLHEVSLHALRRHQTIYFPEATHRMLRDDIVERFGLSLGSPTREPLQRVLTFSTQVDEDGNVVDHKVQAGAIAPPTILTYEQVNAFLHPERAAETKGFTIRNYQPDQEEENAPPTVSWNDQAKQDLFTLQKLTSVFRANRKTLWWKNSEPSVSVQPAADFQTAPRVTLTVPGLGAGFDAPKNDTAADIVAELMILANRTAARFAYERDLIVPYTSQAAPSGDPRILQQLHEGASPDGQISNRDVIQNLSEIGLSPSVQSMVPGPHWGLGIKDEWGYLRATSPLRRYTDLYVHWQIKEALKPRRWRFNRRVDQAVAELVAEISRTAHKDTWSDRGAKHWTLYSLQEEYKKVQAGTARPESEELFNSLEGIVVKSSVMRGKGINHGLVNIPALGLVAHFRFDAWEPIVERGQMIKVKIESFTLSDAPRFNVSYVGPA